MIILLRLLFIVINFSIPMNTTSDYSHLDYEFKIFKSLYVLSMYIIKYKKIIASNFLSPFPLYPN
jgi:hypothetical protein